MSDSILGLYGKTNFTSKKHTDGTPDGTAYHDAAAVALESNPNRTLASLTPGNHGFSGLRGVIVPHANAGGSSQGHDHYAKQKVFIDPELTGGRLQVDLAKVSSAMSEKAYKKAAGQYADAGDVAVAAFMDLAGYNNGQQQVVQSPQPPTYEDRQAPLPLPGAYVVPKSNSDGAQIRPASFSRLAVQPQPLWPTAPLQVAAEIQQASQALREQFTWAPQHRAAVSQPAQLRQVTFELPTGDQITSLYHEVIRSEGILVLIYNHGQPGQMVYFPAERVDDQGNPAALAVLVKRGQQEPEMLYLAFATGIRFRHGDNEYCVMTIEKEQAREAGAA